MDKSFSNIEVDRYIRREECVSSTTTNLGLIIPNLNNEVHQTIQDLGYNFQKIDDAAEVYMPSPPTSGEWQLYRRIWNSQPDVGEYAGWINIRGGVSAPEWEPIKSYTNGDLIVPTSDNGHYYECIQTGYSGVQEPTFPVTSGASVKDIKGSTTWQASTTYQFHDIVVPTVDINRFYVCTVAGVSGSVEPNWSLVDGSTVSDGMVVWTGYRIAVWEEKGTASLFRPFGKIE